MSVNIRPVREDWGEHSSRFVESETLDLVMAFLATGADTVIEESPRADAVLYWFEDGGAVLDLLARSTPETLVRTFLKRNPECKEEREALLSLFENLHVLTPQWREFLDKDNQSLRILSD